MKWYYLVELVVVACLLGLTVVGGSFVIVTQIKKPYVASSKVCCLFIGIDKHLFQLKVKGLHSILMLVVLHHLFHPHNSR